MGEKTSTINAADIDTLQIPVVVKDYFRALYSTMIKDIDISSTDNIDKMITFYSDPDENPMLAMFAGLDIEDQDSLGNITKANFLDFSTNDKLAFMYHFQLLEGKRLADKIRAVPSLAENIRTETKILNKLSDITDMRDKYTEFQKELGKIYNPPIIASARLSSSSSSSSCEKCIEMESFEIDEWIGFVNLLRPYYHRGYTIYKNIGKCSNFGHTATLTEYELMTDKQIKDQLNEYYYTNDETFKNLHPIDYEKSKINIPIAVGAHGPTKSSASSSGSLDDGVTYEDAAAWMQYRGGDIAIYRPIKMKYTRHFSCTITKSYIKIKFLWWYINVPVLNLVFNFTTTCTTIEYDTNPIADKVISQIEKPYCSVVSIPFSKWVAPKAYICSSLNWYTIKKAQPSVNISGTNGGWYTGWLSPTILPYQVALSRRMKFVGKVK